MNDSRNLAAVVAGILKAPNIERTTGKRRDTPLPFWFIDCTTVYGLKIVVSSQTTHPFGGGNGRPTVTTRVLIVDDFAPWRHSVRSMLGEHVDLQFIGEAKDGLEAVQKAKELRPDLILLDIGLPHLNGFEVSEQIHHALPGTAVLFVTQNNDAELARAALSDGVKGYVLKADARKDLWPAIEAVLQGKQFISSGLRR